MNCTAPIGYQSASDALDCATLPQTGATLTTIVVIGLFLLALGMLIVYLLRPRSRF